jgi:hypothetical protein
VEVAAPVAASPKAPQIDLSSLLAAEEASLQMVETAATATQPVVAEEAPAPAAPRRRKPRAAITEEPLQQVETQSSQQ